MVSKCSRAIVTVGGKLLLIQRFGVGLRECWKWQLPGGGIELGETPGHALKRELREEIGMVPMNVQFLGSWRKRVFVFFANLKPFEAEKLVLGSEGIGIGLFTVDEVRNLNITSATRAALPQIEKVLSQQSRPSSPYGALGKTAT